MLLAFIALIAMLDFGLAKVGGLFGAGNLSLKMLLGYAFAPLALVMGVETADALNFGYLLGMKSIAPSRKADLAKLGLKAMVAGALASWLTASIAGILI